MRNRLLSWKHGYSDPSFRKDTFLNEELKFAMPSCTIVFNIPKELKHFFFRQDLVLLWVLYHFLIIKLFFKKGELEYKTPKSHHLFKTFCCVSVARPIGGESWSQAPVGPRLHPWSNQRHLESQPGSGRLGTSVECVKEINKAISQRNASLNGIA